MKRCRKDHKYSKTLKTCPECRKASKEAWYQVNKEHLITRSKAYYVANKEKCKADRKAYYEANKDQISFKEKAAYQVNPDKYKASVRKWQRNNQDRKNVYSAKYRAQKLNATPSWANLEEIAQIYIDAQYIEQLTSVKMHVDHIIPLQGKYISGLHVENNLQILTAEENLSKGNK